MNVSLKTLAIINHLNPKHRTLNRRPSSIKIWKMNLQRDLIDSCWEAKSPRDLTIQGLPNFICPYSLSVLTFSIMASLGYK